MSGKRNKTKYLNGERVLTWTTVLFTVVVVQWSVKVPDNKEQLVMLIGGHRKLEI